MGTLPEIPLFLCPGQNANFYIKMIGVQITNLLKQGAHMGTTIGRCPSRTATRKAQMDAWNGPANTLVMIDCHGIGDDNDYSCYLSRVVLVLWKAGEKEMAWRMMNTDPLNPQHWTNPEELGEYLQTTYLD